MSESGGPVPLSRSSRRSSSVQAQRRTLVASLEPLDWRVLCWLLRYPFQRADDLVVGMARWASRATVYRHLQTLAQHDLVVCVLPHMLGTGKRLYTLGNLGLHVLAASLETPARALARDWHTDDAGLLQLVPRLPTLLPMQDIVNGLVTHAADALTTQTQGSRPTRVRWNWQRDLSHRFRFREQSLRLVLDGAVILGVETDQRDGNRDEHWYGVLLLATELEDERVMRLRLQRLLCWRESAERWSVYQSMLPVVILAHSSRQRDHWQRAMQHAAQQVRVAPLVGTIACIPAGESQLGNPWRLDWRTLSTDRWCHLSDMFQPVPVTALPPSLQAGSDETLTDGTRCPFHAAGTRSARALPARLSRIISGHLPDRLAAYTHEGGDERATMAQLAWHLTPGQWHIVHLLLAHPLLSTEELAVLLHLQRPSVRRALSALHQQGCIVPVTTAVGQRWHLSAHGLHLLAAANRVPVRSIATVMAPDETQTAAVAGSSAIVQRGVSWLVQHIQHTAGIYGFFAHLAQAAEQQSGHALCWWETGALCERRYRVNDQWYNLRPDALADYDDGQHHHQFWFEWDRGTMNVRDLTVKCSTYAHYLASREWMRDGFVVPLLVCVAPDIAQERRLMRVAQATLAKTPGLVVATTTAVLLGEYGPLAAIWVRLVAPHSQREDEGRPRQSLFAAPRVSE